MRLFVILLEVALILGVAIWLLTKPGTVTFEMAGWQTQVQLAVAFLALVVVFFVFHFVLRLWNFIWNLPSRIREKLQQGRPEKGLRALTQSLMASSLEEYDLARSEALKVERFLGENPAYRAIMAYTYIAQGQYAKAQAEATAMKATDEGQTCSWITLARMALAEKKYSLAYENLKKLSERHAKSPWVLRNLLKTALHQKYYDEALETLKRAEKLGVYQSLDAQLIRGLIFSEQAEESQNSLEERASLFERSFKMTSALPSTAVLYAKTLRMQDKSRKARKVLETAWASQPHPNILDEYLLACEATTSKEILSAMDVLSRKSGDNIVASISVAKVALKQEEWGRARAALNEAQEKFDINAEVCHLMAQLELQEHGDQTRYREWMERALESEPFKLIDPQLTDVLR